MADRRALAALAIAVARSVPRRVVGAVIIGVLVVLVAPRVPAVRTVALTAALVPEMVRLGVGPLTLLTDSPARETGTYGNPADRIDFYVPASARAGAGLPGVVLALGVHPQPIDSPEIVAIAQAISRLGVVVGVPDSTPLRNLEVTPAEPGHLADAVIALGSRAEVDPARVGVAGFSAGASIALIAAADPQLAGRLAWVSAFGAYADAKRLLVDVATRTTLDEDGAVIDWLPDPGIRRDVLSLTVNALENAPRDELHAALEPIVAAEQRPPTTSQANRFAGDAAVVYRLFTATDRAQGDAAIADLSPEMQARLDGISPMPVSAAIAVPVFLLHGRPDTAIPVAHAALLRDAIGDEVVRTTIFGRFGHGQPGADGLGIDDAGDIFELSLFLRDIVAAATE